ncbi:hypothetical protein [Streptomyces bauhiniae]|uniref:hypothetical protein n=1 Tax=Streptomyces bauhiniae TaxID=2340725 RepID=UPI0038140FAF
MTGDHAELHELLQRAGLEKAGPVSDARPSRAAWRPVIAASTEPTLTVPDDRPDLVAELNRQWHRLAVERGVIDGDGEFLIHVGDQGCTCWTRVRLAEQWDLAGLLGPGPGQPEFVTMSPDGESVLGVTCEEYEVWFVAVAPFTDWLESAARARPAESPAGREAGWDIILRRKTAPARLRGAWREGLARNPSASPSVLRRLLDVGPEGQFSAGLNRRELPDDMREPVHKLALLDPEAPAELVERLSRDADASIRRSALGHERLSVAALIRLLDDPSGSVRDAAAVDPRLPAHVLTTRLRDLTTAHSAAANPALPEAVMHHLLDVTEIDSGSARAALE